MIINKLRIKNHKYLHKNYHNHFISYLLEYPLKIKYFLEFN